MPHRTFGAGAALLLATPALAQQAEDFRPVTADSNWLIAENHGCLLDGSWGDGIAVTLSRHDDHHDLGVYDPAFKNLRPEKVIPVRFGAGGAAAGTRDYQALGHRDGKDRYYVSDVDDALLDVFATAGSMQFYRGEVLELDLDMVGFPAALAAMRACEAANSPERLAADAVAAAGAAADAAMEPASPQ